MPAITILLRETDDIASALHDVQNAVGDSVGAPRPMHAAATDARSKRYYTVDAADDAVPEALAALRRCSAVEAVFVKPSDARP
jgi:hypothetical protein